MKEIFTVGKKTKDLNAFDFCELSLSIIDLGSLQAQRINITTKSSL